MIMGKFKLLINNNIKKIEIEGFTDTEIINIINGSKSILLQENEVKAESKLNISKIKRYITCNDKKSEVVENLNLEHKRELPKKTSNFMCPNCNQSTFLIDSNTGVSIIRIRDTQSDGEFMQEKFMLFLIKIDDEQLINLLSDNKSKEVEELLIEQGSVDIKQQAYLFDYSNVEQKQDELDLICPCCNKKYNSQKFIDTYKKNHILGLCKYCGEKNTELILDDDGNIIDENAIDEKKLQHICCK